MNLLKSCHDKIIDLEDNLRPANLTARFLALLRKQLIVTRRYMAPRSAISPARFGE